MLRRPSTGCDQRRIYIWYRVVSFAVIADARPCHMPQQPIYNRYCTRNMSQPSRSRVIGGSHALCTTFTASHQHACTPTPPPVAISAARVQLRPRSPPGSAYVTGPGSRDPGRWRPPECIHPGRRLKLSSTSRGRDAAERSTSHDRLIKASHRMHGLRAASTAGHPPRPTPPASQHGARNRYVGGGRPPLPSAAVPVVCRRACAPDRARPTRG